jgi:hypothetical protein
MAKVEGPKLSKISETRQRSLEPEPSNPLQSGKTRMILKVPAYHESAAEPAHRHGPGRGPRLAGYIGLVRVQRRTRT